MFRIIPAMVLSMILAATGCAPVVTPLWKKEAQAILASVRLGGADNFCPPEYRSAQAAFEQGEALLLKDEVREADNYYRFAWTKGKLLERNFLEEKIRRADEVRRRAQEEKLEMERLRDLMEKQNSVVPEKSAREVNHSRQDTAKVSRERLLLSFYTVKRGETLPQISARSDVYNDYRLWPLLYRANRDQIRDPKHVWPGQVIRIPRNSSRDEIAEARHYAVGKQR